MVRRRRRRPRALIRVGLGARQRREPAARSGEARNEIAEDRADRAGLAYLALGDWHGALQIAPRTYYSGTPETRPAQGQRCRPRASGRARRSGPRRDGSSGSRIGRFAWLRHEVELLDGTCDEAVDVLRGASVRAARHRAGAAARRQRQPGRAAPAERALRRWDARLHHLEVDDSGAARRADHRRPRRHRHGAASCGSPSTASRPRRSIPPTPSMPPPALALRMIYLDHVGQVPDAMQLRRIEIRDFRKLGHVVVDDWRDGLNVLVGDNEAGKSTLLAALRAVLFERHRVGGKVARRHAAARPERAARRSASISTSNGARWRLRKAFGQRPEAELSGPGERPTGRRRRGPLAELFGFTPPGTRRLQARRAPGRLWPAVGRAGAITRRSKRRGPGRTRSPRRSKARSARCLGGERGRLLLAARGSAARRFWDKRDRPRGDYKGLRSRSSRPRGNGRRPLPSRSATSRSRFWPWRQRSETLARHAKDDRLGRAVATVAATAGVAADRGGFRARERRS